MKIQIEDYYGNEIGTVEIKNNKISVLEGSKMSIADVNIDGTIRLQADEEPQGSQVDPLFAFAELEADFIVKDLVKNDVRRLYDASEEVIQKAINRTCRVYKEHLGDTQTVSDIAKIVLEEAGAIRIDAKKCSKCGKLSSLISKCDSPINCNADICEDCYTKVGTCCPSCESRIGHNIKYCSECNEKLDVDYSLQCESPREDCNAMICPDCFNDSRYCSECLSMGGLIQSNTMNDFMILKAVTDGLESNIYAPYRAIKKLPSDSVRLEVDIHFDPDKKLYLFEGRGFDSSKNLVGVYLQVFDADLVAINEEIDDVWDYARWTRIMSDKK